MSRANRVPVEYKPKSWQRDTCSRCYRGKHSEKCQEAWPLFKKERDRAKRAERSAAIASQRAAERADKTRQEARVAVDAVIREWLEDVSQQVSDLRDHLAEVLARLDGLEEAVGVSEEHVKRLERVERYVFKQEDREHKDFLKTLASHGIGRGPGSMEL